MKRKTEEEMQIVHLGFLEGFGEIEVSEELKEQIDKGNVYVYIGETDSYCDVSFSTDENKTDLEILECIDTDKDFNYKRMLELGKRIAELFNMKLVSVNGMV